MKKLLAAVSLLVFVGMALYAVIAMHALAPTYDGAALDVAALRQNPQDYQVAEADGVADIIVKQTLDKTHAENVVTAVLFDFRGYDTMGEAFVLFTAIAGCLAILRHTRKEDILHVAEETSEEYHS